MPTYPVTEDVNSGLAWPLAYFGEPGANDVDTLKDMMLVAGWVSPSPLYAVGGMYMIFGIPTTFEPPSPYVGIFDTWGPVNGSYISFYDPRIDDPESIPGILVVKGATETASIAGLIVAMNTAGLNAYLDPDDPLKIIALATVPGTAGNGIGIEGNGTYSIGANTTGGGYRLATGASADSNTGVITVEIVSKTDRLWVSYNLGGETWYDYPCATYAYLALASSRQLLLSPRADADVPFHGGDIYVFNNSLFACCPYIDPLEPATEIAYVSSGYVGIRQRLYSGSVTIRFNGVEGGQQNFLSGFGGGSGGWTGLEKGVSLQTYLYRTGGLKFPSSTRQFFLPPVVGVSDGVPSTTPAYLAGRLWNSYLEPSYRSRGVAILKEGKYQFAAASIGGGDGQQTHTLWILYTRIDPFVYIPPSGGEDTNETVTITVQDNVPWSQDLTVPFVDGTATPPPFIETAYITGPWYMPVGTTWDQDLTDQRIVHLVSTGTPEGKYEFVLSAWVEDIDNNVVERWLVNVKVNSYKNIDVEAEIFTNQGASAGAAYNFHEQFIAKNGEPPYEWLVEPTSSLPPSWSIGGLQAIIDSQLSGDADQATIELPVETGDVGSWTIKLTVSDAVYALDPLKLDHIITKEFGLTLAAGASFPHIVVSGADDLGVLLVTIPISIPYTYDIVAIGGVGSYAWVYVGGLPPGLSFITPSLGALTTISGTPTKKGSYPISIIVRDSLNTEGPAQTFNLKVE